MPKVRLQHNGKSVSIELDPDGDKVRNHNPLRFRISHDVSVNTGINTWFMNRKQLEEVQLQVLTEILEAKQPGGEEAIDNAEKRVTRGQQDLVRAVQQVGRLTHPDVMMLIDMRQNPNQYVNSSSAFASAFNALARKVMDLSFYATGNGPNPNGQREDFIRTTGAVTRGMDQFIYCRVNPSATSPYVNFSVIPAGENYEDVRFPTHFEARTQTKEKIPRTRFIEIYAYYVNELFDCYRRYLRMLGAVEVLPGNTDEVSADVLAQNPGDGPGEGGEEAEEVIEGLARQGEIEADAVEAARERAKQEATEAERRESDEAYTKSARKATKREQKLKEREKSVKKAVKGALEEFKRKYGKSEAPPSESVSASEPAAEAPVPSSLKVEESVPDVSSSRIEGPVERLANELKERLERTFDDHQSIQLEITTLTRGVDKKQRADTRAKLTKYAVDNGILTATREYNKKGKEVVRYRKATQRK